jgi:hypothetical protein
MASGFIGNEVPRKGLRVRSPCPPLFIQPSCEEEFHGSAVELSLEVSDVPQMQLECPI